MSNIKFQIRFKRILMQWNFLENNFLQRDFRMLESGQSLIEMLFALAIATILIVAITAAVLSSLTGVQFSKNQNVATQYAQEGMEYIRELRDSDYATFSSYNNTSTSYYCLDESKTMSTTPIAEPKNDGDCNVLTPDSSNSRYMRYAQILQGGCPDSTTKVTVAVKWSDSKCTDPSEQFCHKSDLVSCLANNTSSL